MAQKPSIHVIGTTQLLAKLRKMGANTPFEAELALKAASILAQEKIKRKLGPEGGSRTGVLYPTGKKGKYAFHQASAPGEPPAVMSGKLRAAIDYKTKRTRNGAEANVGPIGKGSEDLFSYPRDLELGNKKIRPRPYLWSTIVENKTLIVNEIKDSLKTSMSKYRGL